MTTNVDCFLRRHGLSLPQGRSVRLGLASVLLGGLAQSCRPVASPGSTADRREAEYSSARFFGAADGNFSEGRKGAAVDRIILHTTETGPLAAVREIFQNSRSKVSAHFAVGLSGEVWQFVSSQDTAYHCGNADFNRRSIGVELEGYADGGPSGIHSWQTPMQRQALASLIAWLCAAHAIPIDRAHILGHNQIPSPGEGAAKGGGYPPDYIWGGASVHHDPGAWFDWTRLMETLGQPSDFHVLRVKRSTACFTLPGREAPRIAEVSTGFRMVSYAKSGEFYLVFLCGRYDQGQFLPAGEYHWDGWVASEDVELDDAGEYVEIAGDGRETHDVLADPGRGAVCGRTIAGKRHALTGRVVRGDDGCDWYEIFVLGARSRETGWLCSKPGAFLVKKRPPVSQ